MSDEILWTPSEDLRTGSNMALFANGVDQRHDLGIEGDYASLHRWSVDDLPAFWRELADHFEVTLRPDGGDVLSDRSMPGAVWFPGSRVSYVDQVFRSRTPEETAIFAAGESGPDRTITWGELERLTAKLASALTEAGIGQGDRVAGYLPNQIETVITFLATASIGAIWSCCSPDFGDQAVIDRFGQIEPRVLVTCTGYEYGGREFDRSDTVEALLSGLPSVELCLNIESAGRPPGTSIDWKSFLDGGGSEQLNPVFVPFEHPLWILYSSGTTGLPKAIVHSQGGILLEHLKWLGLHVDARPGDRIFWMTTTGWTMWNFVVGALLAGATPVLFDGSPGHPDIDVLWDVAERADVRCFGAGASFYAACQKAGLELRQGRELKGLEAIGSTGSPLAPETFDWLYEQLGPDLWLFSTSGGTDICTAFVGGTPLLPVRKGELQAPALGVDVQAWDAEGNELAGGVGELVVTQPMPSMPLMLWGDESGDRLHDSYFDHYPGVWRHGDWIEFTESGGAIIHGRSDATINRGGIRIGTAEIYRAVMRVDELEDAVVVDVPREDDESWMPLFVSLKDGIELDQELERRIRQEIREGCSPRHVPQEVIQAPEIPRTLSGKVLEVPLKRLMMGEAPDEVASRDSLANPTAFDWFVDFASRRNG